MTPCVRKSLSTGGRINYSLCVNNQMMECRMVNSPDLNCSWCCRLIISVRIRYLCGNQCQLLRSLLLRWPSLAAGRPRALGRMFEAAVSHLICLWLCRPVNAPLSRSRLDLSVCCCLQTEPDPSWEYTICCTNSRSPERLRRFYCLHYCIFTALYVSGFFPLTHIVPVGSLCPSALSNRLPNQFLWRHRPSCSWSSPLFTPASRLQMLTGRLWWDSLSQLHINL